MNHLPKLLYSVCCGMLIDESEAEKERNKISESRVVKRVEKEINWI